MGRASVDYTGRVFEQDDYWVKVLYEIEPIRHKDNGTIKYRRYHCLCKCGTEFDTNIDSLKNGSTTSCGCRKSANAQKVALSIIGQRFESKRSHITVLSIEKQGRSLRETRMRCLCQCGKEFITSLSNIVQNKVHSCGCERYRRAEDIVGQVFQSEFNSVTIIKELPYHTYQNGVHTSRVLCKCSCGKEFITLLKNLKSGKTRSCGCTSHKKNIEIGGIYGNDQYFVQVLNEVEPGVSPSGREVRRFACRCKCGNDTIVDLRALFRKEVSCGCKIKDLQNKNGDPLECTYGYLKPIRKVESKKTKQGTDSQYLCKCLNCGNEKVIRGRYLRAGKITHCGCLHIQSHGERRIAELLNNMGLDYEIQKKMDDCVNPETNYSLKFDFYLHSLRLLIEFDGEQHFASTKSGWRTETHLQNTIFRDKVKNAWCLNNQQALLRIPFTEIDLLTEDYLTKQIELALLNEQNNVFITLVNEQLYLTTYAENTTEQPAA